jgi:hypothetical protein
MAMNPDPETLKRLREFCREELKRYNAEKKRSVAKISKAESAASKSSSAVSKENESANTNRKHTAVGG